MIRMFRERNLAFRRQAHYDMKTYPIMLNLSGRRVVVIGGGEVGLRKARSLADAGAEVLLVAEKLDGSAPARAEVRRERYRADQLAGAALVLACTDDRAVNARIAADARAVGAMVNVADRPEDCDFFLPAVATDGEVVLAVGTGGAAPGLAGMLRDRLAGAIPERIGEFAAALGTLRRELRDAVCEQERRMAILKELSGQQGYELFLRGGPEALRERMNAMGEER
ncbi:MAG TPA: siroheme synthase [Phycisphaerales bacterium]|nr:siroheme synthase [Phycisphaerales bacterium]